MTNRDLGEFGTLRRVFQGSGHIVLDDDEEFETEFTLAQKQDAGLLFSADIPRLVWESYAAQNEVKSLAGTLSDGRDVRLLDSIVHKQTSSLDGGSKTRLIGFPSRWEIGKREFADAATVDFELVNFLFVGTEAETVGTTSTLSLLPLDLGDRRVEIRQAPNYKEARSTLYAQKGIQITCTARTAIRDSSELEDTISIMETMCTLMTFARGTIVNWSSFDVRDSSESPIYSVYRNSIVRSYAPFQLIQATDRCETRSFLERGFSRHRELDQDFQLKRVSRAYAATRDGSFLEIQCMLIGALVEHLASKQAELDDRVWLEDPKEFNQGLDSLKQAVGQAIRDTYPNIRNRHLKAMLLKLRELNRRPLNWKLSSLTKSLKLPLVGSEVKDFVQIRDSLAHTTKFPDGKVPIECFGKMLHFLERIILRLLDYRGPYYDIEHHQDAEL